MDIQDCRNHIDHIDEQLQALFQTTQQNISLHINNIYKEGELEEDRTHKKYLLVRSEGSRSVKRNISHYNLDMILAVGMRAKSDVAVGNPASARIRGEGFHARRQQAEGQQ